jgi:hypothetical protein
MSGLVGSLSLFCSGMSGRETGAPVRAGCFREAGDVLQRTLGIAIVILIVVWIVANPAGAGDSVHSWITGIITFFKHLA